MSDVWAAHRGEGGFPARSTDEGEVEQSRQPFWYVEVVPSPKRRASIKSTCSLDKSLQLVRDEPLQKPEDTSDHMSAVGADAMTLSCRTGEKKSVQPAAGQWFVSVS